MIPNTTENNNWAPFWDHKIGGVTGENFCYYGLLFIRQLDVATGSNEVFEADSSKRIETTADSAESSTEDSSHKETGNTRNVTHHLHHEQRKYLIWKQKSKMVWLGLDRLFDISKFWLTFLFDLSTFDRVAIMIIGKHHQTSIGANHQQSANPKDIPPNSP